MTDSRTPRMFRVVSSRMSPNLDRELSAVPRRRQKAEERVSRRGDRDGDGQHVVDQQRRARDDAARCVRAACVATT